MPDEGGRIAAADLQCALERVVGALRVARREARLAEDDQRLAVIAA